jgi:hypothetical protein
MAQSIMAYHFDGSVNNGLLTRCASRRFAILAIINALHALCPVDNEKRGRVVERVRRKQSERVAGQRTARRHLQLQGLISEDFTYLYNHPASLVGRVRRFSEKGLGFESARRHFGDHF